jgi:hypothetical protein
MLQCYKATNAATLKYKCFLPSLTSFGQAVSEEKIFLTLANQKKRINLGGHVCKWIGTK